MEETEIMKHSEKYLQAKWVTENPDGYDERDVVDAKRYCNAYLDGYNQALRTPDAAGRSKEFYCFDSSKDGGCKSKCESQCDYCRRICPQ